jgi:hypothetical protein
VVVRSVPVDEQVTRSLKQIEEAIGRVARLDLPADGVQISDVIYRLREGKEIKAEQAKLAPVALEAIAAVVQVPKEGRDLVRAALGISADHRRLFETIEAIFLD